MDIKKIILEKLDKNDFIKASEVAKELGFSRVYINKFLKELREEGKVVLMGKANKARYVKADKEKILKERKKILKIKKTFLNDGISEDPVFKQLKSQTGIFIDMDEELYKIIAYAFTEMFNNAIEHSKSKKIETTIERNGLVKFSVIDKGIGIFKNIKEKRSLNNEIEAIQELLKGKQTTAPKAHSGEGIFFTSKIADNFIIESSDKRLMFNNNINDIFIEDIKEIKGTKVIFVISSDSKKKLESIFQEYAGDSFEFNKTRVAIRLYKMGDLYISRSQARRVVTALDKFKNVVLDFKHIKSIGQAFADEVFRVWQGKHPNIKIETVNTNENIDFMINRAIGGKQKSLLK